MIPYFDISIFKLGPLTIHIWGVFVSIGVAVALLVAWYRAKKIGLDSNRVLDIAFWILIAAFLGARLFHVFFYEWHYYSMHLWEIFRIDQGGLSSFGGFIGAATGFLIYGTWRRIELLNYADVLMFVWPLGHGIGRIGCFLTHMHPGRLSNVLWAVQYPQGARLDMGIIESAILLSYWIILYLFTRGRQMFAGFYVISGMLFYGIMRFTLDFFRATDLSMSDTRYFGLTPAQYGSVALIIGGIAFWQRFRKRKTVLY
ncbi:MAG: prolipoprotein diacylglyceryl transferase [bacterium]|nr:prolipoprotein diacylglyceryl transferase [bacterium]